MANDDITGLSEEDLVQEKNNLHEQLEQVRAQLKNNPSGPMLNTKQATSWRGFRR
jgi:ribosomal protein L29